MTFADLAVLVGIGLIGPFLSWGSRWRISAVVGELGAGFVLGRSGLDVLHPDDPTFSFLADIGFALVMFVAGSHVPLRDAMLRSAVGRGILWTIGIAALAAAGGFAIARAFGTGHGALYAVLLASSSAALVLPIVQSIGLSGPHALRMMAQVAVADTACIVALPMAIEPARAGRAALGASAVIAASLAIFVVLRWTHAHQWERRLRRISRKHGLALELRLNLLILFGLAALAVWTHVSVLLAGFTFGLVVAAIGQPHRLARQVFGVTQGLFAPLFFVWLGATLDLSDLVRHPHYTGLGLALGLTALAIHAALRLVGQPLSFGLLSAAQLGVPIAAVTIGTQSGILDSGEGAALILGALVTIVAAAGAGAAAQRRTGDAAAQRRAGDAADVAPDTAGAAADTAPDTAGTAD